MNTSYVIWAILAMSAVTFFLRSVPFILPQALIQMQLIQKAAKIMPLLIMTILVIHSFNGTTLGMNGTALPVAVGVAATAIFHLRYRIPFISIVAGVGSHSFLITFFS